MKLLFAYVVGALSQVDVLTRDNPIVLTGTCLDYSLGQCHKIAAWHVYKGSDLLDAIRTTEVIDRFETDVLTNIDCTKLGRQFRKDQTKLIFGDVVDGKFVSSPDTSNVYMKSLEIVVNVIRQDNYNASPNPPKINEVPQAPPQAPPKTDESIQGSLPDPIEIPPVIEIPSSIPTENLASISPQKCFTDENPPWSTCNCGEAYPSKTRHIVSVGDCKDPQDRIETAPCDSECIIILEDTSGDYAWESSGEINQDDEDLFEDFSSRDDFSIEDRAVVPNIEPVFDSDDDSTQENPYSL